MKFAVPNVPIDSWYGLEYWRLRLEQASQLLFPSEGKYEVRQGGESWAYTCEHPASGKEKGPEGMTIFSLSRNPVPY
jgi:hypothetical protein